MKASEARQLTEQKENTLNEVFNEIRIESMNRKSFVELDFHINDGQIAILEYLGYEVETVLNLDTNYVESKITIIRW